MHNISKHYNHIEIFEDFIASKYTALLPPPNVTGTLHLGHSLVSIFLDCYTRKKQFEHNFSQLVIGTDHAGIAAQYIAEKHMPPNTLDKLEFMKNWQTVKQAEIESQLSKLALHTDINKMHFTLDKNFADLVSDVFIKMYNDGLIYRDYRPINWDPILQTVVSDYEVEMKETIGQMFYLLFEGDGFKGIPVATTRPETIPGDRAIAVHPDDDRYKQYIGKSVFLPLQKIKIPVVGDERIDPTFGTGAVKITPAHSFTDFNIAKTHNLSIKQVIDKNQNLTDGPFSGLHILEAREKYASIAYKIDQIHHLIPIGDRSQSLLEILPLKQWFCNISQIAKDITLPNFYPEIYSTRIQEHIQNLQPWCLSRQIWWGHRIPAYICSNNEYIVANNLEQAEKIAYEKNLQIVAQDQDVLDTWFSSSLWHIGTQSEYKPIDLLVTGYDILNIWVARMCIQSKYLYNQKAFKDVVITGLIRDSSGAKMSKSKGNTLNPIDLINEYGIDAFRFALMHACSAGQDVVLHKTRIEGMHRFLTKLWNVARFCLSHNLTLASPVNDWDCYWACRFQILKEKLDALWASYKIAEVCNLLYTSFKDEFANFYLEGTKIVENCSIGYFLAFWLQQLYPIIPCITCDIWNKCFSESILSTISVKNIKNKNNIINLVEIIENIKKVKIIMPDAKFNISADHKLIAHFTKAQFTENTNFIFNNLAIFITDADHFKIKQRYQKLQTEYMQVMSTQHYFTPETPENIKIKNMNDLNRIKSEISFLDNFL